VLPSSPDMLQVKEAAKKRKRSEAAKKAARTRKKRQQQREQLQRQTITATRRDLVGTTAATRRDLVGNFDEVAVDCQLPATAAIAGSPSSSKIAKLEEKVHQLETMLAAKLAGDCEEKGGSRTPMPREAPVAALAPAGAPAGPWGAFGLPQEGRLSLESKRACLSAASSSSVLRAHSASWTTDRAGSSLYRHLGF